MIPGMLPHLRGRAGIMTFQLSVPCYKPSPPPGANCSGGFREGSRGLLEPLSGADLFHCHGGISRNLCEIKETNPPFLHLNPFFRNPGSATETVGQKFALCPTLSNRKSPWGKDPNVKTLSFPLHCGDTRNLIAPHFS